MNQSQNNLNENNVDTKETNGGLNNQSLKNHNFNQKMNFNCESQPISDFQDFQMRESIQQSNNTFASGNISNQNLNSKLSKKRHLGLIIGIIVGIIICVIVSLIFIKLNNNTSPIDNIINKKSNTVKVGNIKINVLSDENVINNSGLYKVGDEYIFKGGDLYSKKLEDGSYNSTTKLGNLKNFVKFNNNYWRIIKINSDGTIKLVWAGKYDGDEVLNNIDLDIKYADKKTNNLNYENSYIRNYLNTIVLNDNSIIPSNYTDYLVKSNWDISTYTDSIYNIYSYKNSENVVTKQMSLYKDYIGILSITDFYNAKIAGKLPPKGAYDNNFIEDILESTGKQSALEVNTSNIIVDENNNSIGVAKIVRSNGSWFMLTNSAVDGGYGNDVIPVITLKSTINFESGNGSVENPYIIK